MSIMSHESPRLWRRILRALKRAVLGRSTHDYGARFTGGDEYWDRAIAAQLGWPQRQSPKTEPDRFPSLGNAVMATNWWLNRRRAARDEAANGANANGTKHAQEAQTRPLSGL